MWQRITALGFPPLYSERTARIPQEAGDAVGPGGSFVHRRSLQL